MMEAQHVVKNQKPLRHNDEGQKNYLYHYDVCKSPTNPSGVPNFHLQIQTFLPLQALLFYPIRKKRMQGD
jgi:hypothetical protein